MTTTLKKNESKSLNDLGGSSPLLVFAIGWDNKEKPGLLNNVMNKRYEADFDLSCVVYDDQDERLDCVWYAQLNSKDGSIRHKGDDTVGVEGGDDETIIIDLNALKAEARTLFFVISSFSGDSFAHAENTYWRIFDGASKREITRVTMAPTAKTTAKIVMRMQKVDTAGITEWHVKALDESATGKNIQEIFPEIRMLIEQ